MAAHGPASLDHGVELAELQTAHDLLMSRFVMLRPPRSSDGAVVRVFTGEHIKKALGRLQGTYAELAVLVPSEDPLDAWLAKAQEEVQNFRSALPTRSYLSLARRLQGVIFWTASATTASVLTFHLAGWCLCWLGKFLAIAIPMSLIAIAVSFGEARSALDGASDEESARSAEAPLAGILGLPLRRETPWDIICVTAAAAWCFAVPAVFVDVVFKYHASTIAGTLIALMPDSWSRAGCFVIDIGQ
jgi:hypothetical protein